MGKYLVQLSLKALQDLKNIKKLGRKSDLKKNTRTSFGDRGRTMKRAWTSRISKIFQESGDMEQETKSKE